MVDYLFKTHYPKNGKRWVEPIVEKPQALLEERGDPVELVSFGREEGDQMVVVVRGGSLVLLSTATKKSMFGGAKVTNEEYKPDIDTSTKVTSVEIDPQMRDLYVGNASGYIRRFSIEEPESIKHLDTVKMRGGKAVTILKFLLGGSTLVSGDSAGDVTTWQLARAEGGEEFSLKKMHIFDSHDSAIKYVAASRRNKGFMTADEHGNVWLRYGTTGKTRLKNKISDKSISYLQLAPKYDGFVGIAGDKVYRWSLDDPHPQISFDALFGKLWYEGYEKPDYVWQSTGGTDEFEPKFSLTPLIFGTLKGTFYSMLIAIPLAVFAAIYTSQFMNPRLRGIVKPSVEIMAALPSVVLGFLAGLWLAPIMEDIAPGVLLTPVVVPTAIVTSLILWQYLVPLEFRMRLSKGSELFILIPVVLVACWASIYIGYAFEDVFLMGDYKHWVKDVFGTTFDQRNTLVVGLAMAIAVIPIIFTISEDSLSNVPNHLASGSLALGATPWQTAIRVVLPAASPGIFSAIMIGFGRIVGETMIVLMATGNTPVMDFSIFDGFRAMSANIAVELPEAPQEGTLYRVLFLAAMLLFAITFVANTIAEIVRLRLRKRYSEL